MLERAAVMPHPLPARRRQTHLVLKVDTQSAVEAEGTQGSGFAEAPRLPIWRMQHRLQIHLQDQHLTVSCRGRGFPDRNPVFPSPLQNLSPKGQEDHF